MPIAEPYTLSAAEGQGYAAEASLDMASLLLSAYELGDWINQSAEVAEYAYWKRVVGEDVEAAIRQREFAKAKELFSECERFGRFHPDYHEAKDKVKAAEKRLGEIESVQRFKQAEQTVDEMLHQVALIIAESVSETIKVPSNEKGSGGGCGSGGSCGCGSGGCS
ncbi:YlbF family regulator [Paenibacillus sp. strain BS8-2]